MSLHHAAGHHNVAHILETANTHQHCGDRFVTACNEYAAVKPAGVGLRFHQIDNRFPVSK